MTMTEESREVREARAPVWEAEVPWVVAYLREDIQDLRNEVRETRRLTVESYGKLDAKIDELRQDVDAKIDGLRQDIDTRFRWTLTTMVAVGALIVAALKLLP
jgi:hypothetical protein